MTPLDNCAEEDVGNGPEQSISTSTLICYLLESLDGLDVDHPEVWDFLESLGEQAAVLLGEVEVFPMRSAFWTCDLLRAILLATLGRLDEAERVLSQVLMAHSQSVLANGAMFRLRQMESPRDPKFALRNFVCKIPFQQLHVLDESSHLCCASWLPANAGDLYTTPWEDVWNSQNSQRVRAAILDGSYRYCNKTACPAIMAGLLTPKAELVETDPWWKEVIEENKTSLDRGPVNVNLAYDKTCNLSCPSCRQSILFQGPEERKRTEEMQARNILPMLEQAEFVTVTGSGDPFSSPTFRKLLKAFDPVQHPKLKVDLMTNGMLLTEERWKEYANLAGHVATLKFSLDGATRETHELLRRGSRWDRVYENLHFCARLRDRGDIGSFAIVFVVQVENYQEMGAFVDLGHEVGADTIYFVRMTNWGTFSHGEYEKKAVFLPTHPQYAEFVRGMQDSRLRDSRVALGDLAVFRVE